MQIDPAELDRYSRQICLPEVGLTGQSKLKKSRVLIAGAGGLGCPCATYLASSGIGHLTLIDADQVSLSNLPRQILYSDNHLEQPKVDAAHHELAQRNPKITIDGKQSMITAENSYELCSGHDLIIDCTDNLVTKAILSRTARTISVPFIFAAVTGFQGIAAWFDGSKGPCYQCLFPDSGGSSLIPTCSSAGVIPTAPGILGLIQANLAIQVILGTEKTDYGQLLTVDLQHLDFHRLPIPKNPQCPNCHSQKPEPKSGPFLQPQEEYNQSNQKPATANESVRSILPSELAGHHVTPFILVDLRAPKHRSSQPIPGAIHINTEYLQEFAGHNHDQSIVLCCYRGNESQRVASRYHNVANIYSLAGGAEAYLSHFSAH